MQAPRLVAYNLFNSKNIYSRLSSIEQGTSAFSAPEVCVSVWVCGAPFRFLSCIPPGRCVECSSRLRGIRSSFLRERRSAPPLGTCHV